MFSNSFNLEVGDVKQTMIYVDNVLHAIRDGALVQMVIYIFYSDLVWPMQLIFIQG